MMLTATKASREFSDTSREAMASKGIAMPDGSFPIPDKGALRRAIQSFGRAKDPAAVRRHIVKRARALGAMDLLPEGWASGSTKGSMAAQHSAQAADILEDLYCLIDCEADEPAHVQMLTSAADIMVRFLQTEAAEIGGPDDYVEMAAYEKARLGKAFSELKAEPMDGSALDRWLSGKIPRRVLVVPFGGPLPGGKAGLDLDGEYFDEDTDLFGRFEALKRTRERLVDWHHDDDPTGMMKGAILGKIVLDEGADKDGWWADFWANAGEARRALMARLEKGGVPLFGSSQAVAGAIRKAKDGHIEVWPLIRHTITTSPQNTWAVVPPLKALLTADFPSEVGIAAFQAALVGLDDTLRSGASFPSSGRGDGPGSSPGGGRSGKAGRVLSRKNEALVAEIRERAELLLLQLKKLQAAPANEEDSDSEG